MIASFVNLKKDTRVTSKKYFRILILLIAPVALYHPELKSVGLLRYNLNNMDIDFVAKNPPASFFSGPLLLAATAIARNDLAALNSEISSKPIDLNAPGASDMRLVSYAAGCKNWAAFDFLVAHGATLNFSFRRGQTVQSFMGLAASAKDDELFKKMIAARADPNGVPEAPFPDMNAVEQGRVDNFWTLIRLGANINQKDRNGTTLLMRLAYRGDYDIILKLIERGADTRPISKLNKSLTSIVRQHPVDPGAPGWEPYQELLGKLSN